MTTVAELREHLQKLKNAGYGYGSWDVLVMPDDRDDPILDDIEYRVCGVDDPAQGDADAGYLFLRLELVSTGQRGLSVTLERIGAALRDRERQAPPARQPDRLAHGATRDGEGGHQDLL
jgi:hypothetical protein